MGMTDRERLEKLLERSDENRGVFGMAGGEQWGLGNIPVHYKRCTISEEKRDEYAMMGLAYIAGCFLDTYIFYTQALIAGCAISGDFDQITIVCCSQYGKTWLMGRLALIMAYQGHKMNIGGSTEPLTEKIMRQCMASVSTAAKDIKKALTAETLRRVDKLDQSLSKQRLSFPGKGQVQGVSLGETFDDIDRNKAIGESGAWIIDEAALISEKSMSELGRREFSSIDGSVEPLIMISNPHKPGYFYDQLTGTPKKRECVIWADALTMAQEGRRSREFILESKFAETRDTIQRYLLCELPSQGGGMFSEPVVKTQSVEGMSFLGIDAAYRGKDSIEVCHAIMTGDHVYFSAVETIQKRDWIDGVTSKEIIEQISKIYHALGCALCCVDIGFGVWLTEGLLQNGCVARGVNFGAGASKWRIREDKAYSAVFAQNLRAEMHLDLADLIERKTCTFSEQVYGRIKEVLPFVISETKSNGKIQVMPKAEIKARVGHSPDAFDAVLLALHAIVLYGADAVDYITEVA